MNEKPNNLAILGVAMAVMGWLFSAVGIYVTLNSRIAVLENGQRNSDQRMPYIEAKLDRLIERSK